MKKILVILDGLADLPLDVFNGKTPLETAYTPNLDYFARNGKLGFMFSVDENTVPGSDNALISIFGNDPKQSKRGIYEAIGAGIKLNKEDLALRTNFVTIDNLKNRKVIDRRAGRNLTNKEAEILCKDINEKIKLSCEFEFKNTVQHRGILVLRKNKFSFSDNISNVDNEWSKIGIREEYFDFSKPLDNSKEAETTTKIINNFIEQSFFLLHNHPINTERVKKGFFPANIIFLRGAGNRVPKIKQYRDWISINSMPLEVGIAELSGMRNFSYKIPEFNSLDIYEHLYKIINSQIKFSIKILKKYHKKFNGCYIHFKEIDDAGHDNKPLDKKKMIEIIDRDFFSFLKKFSKKNSIKIVVTSDHSTPCKNKGHSADAVPVLVYSHNEKNDNILAFNEIEAMKGSLGKIYGKDFMRVTGLR